MNGLNVTKNIIGGSLVYSGCAAIGLVKVAFDAQKKENKSLTLKDKIIMASCVAAGGISIATGVIMVSCVEFTYNNPK